MKNLKLATAMTVCLTALMLVVGSNTALARTYRRSCQGRYEFRRQKEGGRGQKGLTLKSVRLK